MADKKKIKAKIDRALAVAKAQKRLVIIDMPEEMETAPHWLLWLTVFSLVGLIIAIGLQLLSASNSLQAYLPFL